MKLLNHLAMSRAQLFQWVRAQADRAARAEKAHAYAERKLQEAQGALVEALGGGWQVPAGQEAILIPHNRVQSFTDTTTGDHHRIERRASLSLYLQDGMMDTLVAAIVDARGGKYRRGPYIAYRGILWRLDDVVSPRGGPVMVIELNLSAFARLM